MISNDNGQQCGTRATANDAVATTVGSEPQNGTPSKDNDHVGGHNPSPVKQQPVLLTPSAPPPSPPPIPPSTLQLPDSRNNNQDEDGYSTPQPPISNGLSPADSMITAKQILRVPSDQRSPNRKGSMVNFQEGCQLHMIDLSRDDNKPTKPSALVSVRYYIMLLALISPFVVTYSKTIINFAIIDMIHPDFRSGSRANKQELVAASTTIEPILVDVSKAIDSEMILLSTPAYSERQEYFELDNSCPVSPEDRVRLINTSNQDKKRAQDRPGEKFEWDTVKQGLLKAAYSIGHSLFSIIGGRLAEIFGSHWTMGLSSFLIGICCLTAPFLASAHFYILFADLTLLGILGSFMTPALITLFANWLTPSEKSMMISFYLVSSRLGYALSSLLCGLLIEAQLSWRYLFYSAGWVSFIFAALFLLLSKSNPTDHPCITQDELDYLASKNTLVREGLVKRREAAKSRSTTVEMQTKQNQNQVEFSDCEDVEQNESKPKKLGAPWFAILTNVPMWAFIITKFCVKLAGDTVQIELPTYLSRVMHFSSKDNGFINSSNYVIFCLSCLLAGALAKTANKKRPFGWSKTTVRKVFQSIASFGVAITLLGISFSTCNNTMTLTLLMLMFFVTTFGTGGEAQIPLDISERYAGTIHAIGSSLAISGAIEPILVGFLLRGHAADKDSWAFVWMGAGAIAAFGGLVFLIFGDASKQKFDEIGLEQEDNGEDYSSSQNDSSGIEESALNEGPTTKTVIDDESEQKESVQI